jgi:putative two-component system response regulator
VTDGQTGRKSILLIDDDAMQLTAARVILEDEYEVYIVRSGKEALGYLYRGACIPDLILLDNLMPNMDGWEIFNRIRGIGLLYNVPIVFLTAVSAATEVNRAFETGAADYITKPYDKKTLLTKVRELIK